MLVAGLIGAAGVGLGAYAAHGLEANLIARGLPTEQIAKKLNTCDIAVRYHLIHAVALLALAAAPAEWARKRRSLAAICMLLGLTMFCGVLYAQGMAGLVGFNLVVPLGGLSFIMGWLIVASCSFHPSSVPPRT